MLTYMSIRDEINHRCNEGRLRLLLPAIPGSLCVRHLFISSEIQAAISGPWSDVAEELRFGFLRATLDTFTEGMLIAVGKDPYKKGKIAYMCQLDPVTDEVWEIRSRAPKPGIRIFGSFSEKDSFIALTWLYREGLGGPKSREWRDAREGCKAEWRKLFPAYNPHTGENFDDYASNIFLV